MKNFVFISPNFPTNYWQFCKHLKDNGLRVLGVGDCPYDDLLPELRASLTEYYKVGSMENYDEVYRAVAFFISKYGRIDWLESNNEYWLERDAMLRTDFNIPSGFHVEDMERIKYTMEHIDRAAFDAAVTALLEADGIYLFGARSASMLSGFLGMNLGLVFDNVKNLQPTSASEVFEQLLPIGPRDVLFAISFPRYSQKLVKAVRYAHDRGARVIALTDTPTSPIAADATYLLTAQSDMAAFADSLVAPLSIINAMIAEITRRRATEIKERFARMERLWDEYDVYAKP